MQTENKKNLKNFVSVKINRRGASGGRAGVVRQNCDIFPSRDRNSPPHKPTRHDSVAAGLRPDRRTANRARRRLVRGRARTLPEIRGGLLASFDTAPEPYSAIGP